MKIPKDIDDQLIWTTVSAHSGDDLQFPYVKGIKPQSKPCEDCEQVVKDRKLLSRLSKIGWLTRCTNCNKHYRPITRTWEDVTYQELLKQYQENNKKTK